MFKFCYKAIFFTEIFLRKEKNVDMEALSSVSHKVNLWVDEFQCGRF